MTTTTSQLDDINLRFVHTFGAVPQRGGARGGGRGGGGGGRGGPGGGRAGVSNLNIGIHFRHSDNTNANPFPTLGGTTTISAWDIPVSYSFTKAGMLHSLRFDFNHQHAQTTEPVRVQPERRRRTPGVLGVSTDPFDWGAPNLSFSHFASVRDITPSTRTDRTISFGDTIVKTRGKQHAAVRRRLSRHPHRQPHRRQRARQLRLHRSVHRPRLRRLPARPSAAGDGAVRSRTSSSFRSTSWDLFVQDDWRATDKVTVNAGLRYEYFSPVSEANNRLVTLDVAPDFTAAVPVAAGETGPFSGHCPTRSSVRSAAAWRRASASPGGRNTGTVIRGGYGINYNSSVYQYIAQQLAAQSPCATVNTCCDPASESRWFRSKRRCCTCSAGSTHQQLRRRSGLPPAARADLESRPAARSDADGAARRRLHRHEGHRTSTSCARRIAVPTGSLDSGRAAVHLGIVGRRFAHALAHAAASAGG